MLQARSMVQPVVHARMPQTAVVSPSRTRINVVFARAVRAEIAERAPTADAQIDIVDGDVVAEPLGQPTRLDRPAQN